MTNPHRVPVLFSLGADDWHGHASESMWTESLDGERFVVLNTPFFVKGLSLDDEITAVLTDEGYRFQEVTRRGGHSTYRIILKAGAAPASEEIARLRAAGCSWEEGPGTLLAVDVPPAADIEEVYAALEVGAAAGIWDFEEGHVGHEIAR